MWMHAEGKHLPSWAESTGLCCLVSGNCHILGAWSWRMQGPEPSLEAVGGEHLKDVHCWNSWQSGVVVKSRNEEGHSLLWCLWMGWEASTDPKTAFSSMCALYRVLAKDLTWNLSNSTNPEQQFSSSCLLGTVDTWVPCQLQKTKVDPRTVGYFWRLDRITAGDTGLACPRLKKRDCVICRGLLHNIIHKRPLKRPAPLKVFLHSSWVLSLTESIL